MRSPANNSALMAQGPSYQLSQLSRIRISLHCAHRRLLFDCCLMMRYGGVNKKYKSLIINNKILQYAEIRRFGTRARSVGVEIGANASEYTGNVPNRPVFLEEDFLDLSENRWSI